MNIFLLVIFYKLLKKILGPTCFSRSKLYLFLRAFSQAENFSAPNTCSATCFSIKTYKLFIDNNVIASRSHFSLGWGDRLKNIYVNISETRKQYILFHVQYQCHVYIKDLNGCDSFRLKRMDSEINSWCWGKYFSVSVNV